MGNKRLHVSRINGDEKTLTENVMMVDGEISLNGEHSASHSGANTSIFA